MMPPGAVTPSATRLLLAMVRVYDRQGRCTIREVVAEAGYASIGSTHKYLRELRAAGLVAWDDGRTGTLRPLVRHTIVT